MTTATDMTVDDMLSSLTGFDEIAVTKNFGHDFGDFGQVVSKEGSSAGGRALIFVHLRRQGETDPKAFERAMGLSLREVNDYFAAEPDDPETEDDTPVGKDGPLTAGQPAS